MNGIFEYSDYIGIKSTKNTPYMTTFGAKLRECRKAEGLSQSELAAMLSTNHSIIGKYERDVVKPSIDTVKRIADLLGTTTAYLIGEVDNAELFRDPDMLKRLKAINELPEEDRKCVLYNLDAVLRDFKARTAYAS